LYGGGFERGSASTPLYASGLPKATGVILINGNYRVGPLGFLAHPELSAGYPHHFITVTDYAYRTALRSRNHVRSPRAFSDGYLHELQAIAVIVIFL
jgi:Carboxylesterase family